MNDHYHLLSFNDEGRARAGLLIGERVYPYGPQLGELLQLDMHDLTVTETHRPVGQVGSAIARGSRSH